MSTMLFCMTNLYCSILLQGLISAAGEVLPRVQHRMCARHIYVGWGKDFRVVDLKMQFWACAKSPNGPEYEKNIKLLKMMSEEGQ